MGRIIFFKHVSGILRKQNLTSVYIPPSLRDTILQNVYMHACVLSHVQLCVTLCTVACQAPLSMAFSRQKYWGGVAISFSRGSSWPRYRTCVSWVSCLGKHVLYHCAIWKISVLQRLFLKFSLFSLFPEVAFLLTFILITLFFKTLPHMYVCRNNILFILPTYKINLIILYLFLRLAFLSFLLLFFSHSIHLKLTHIESWNWSSFTFIYFTACMGINLEKQMPLWHRAVLPMKITSFFI